MQSEQKKPNEECDSSEYYNPDDMDDYDLYSDESVLITENKKERKFHDFWNASMMQITKEYSSCSQSLAILIGLKKSPIASSSPRDRRRLCPSATKDDSDKKTTPLKQQEERIEFLGLWQKQVVACFKFYNRFMGNIMSAVSRAEGQDENSQGNSQENCEEQRNQETTKTNVTYDQLISGVQTITRITEKCLLFYRLSVKLIPVQEAVKRIKKAHGSLNEFATATRICWMSEARTLTEYTLMFMGPVGSSALLAFGMGLLLTGWGALIIAGGALVGTIATGLYHHSREKSIAAAQLAMEQEIARNKGFFARWNMLDQALESSDLVTALDLLNSSQECFDIVCDKLFQEIQQPLHLSDQCYICLDDLLASHQLDVVSQYNLKIPKDYKAQCGDIVMAESCAKPHMIHFECYQSMSKALGPAAPIRHCGTCRTPFTKWKIAYRERPLPKQLANSSPSLRNLTELSMESPLREIELG